MKKKKQMMKKIEWWKKKGYVNKEKMMIRVRKS